jgi:hypothetical protein
MMTGMNGLTKQHAREIIAKLRAIWASSKNRKWLALLLVVSVYQGLDTFWLEPEAKKAIFESLTRRRDHPCALKQQCSGSDMSFVSCKEKYNNASYEFFWKNKGAIKISGIINQKYESLGNDFQKLKEWLACQGFVVLREGKHIYIDSNVIHGYGIVTDYYLPFVYYGGFVFTEEAGGKLKMKPTYAIE